MTGLDSKRLKAIGYSEDAIEKLELSLQKIENGTPLDLNEAIEASTLLNSINKRGLFNFHRTEASAIEKIVSSNSVIPGQNHNKIFALPFYTNGNGNWTAGKNVGDSNIVFQGQAAALFNDRKIRGPFSVVGRLQKHQIANGQIVIEASKKMEDGTLVITKARLAAPDRNLIGKLKGQSFDVADILYLPALGAGAVGSYILFSNDSE